jgi:pyrroline-5-carboxylate reductase
MSTPFQSMERRRYPRPPLSELIAAAAVEVGLQQERSRDLARASLDAPSAALYNQGRHDERQAILTLAEQCRGLSQLRQILTQKP